MRKGIYYLLILCLFPMFEFFAFAQKPQARDVRILNLSILNALDEYERVISFSGVNDKRDFLRLFSDPDSQCVYNDVLGSADFQDQISPRRYVDDIPEDGTSIYSSSISNVKKEGEPYYDNGVLHRIISLDKYLMIIDASVYTKGEGGVLFDSSQNFEKAPDFKLFIDFAYDPVKNRCFICSIEADKKKSASPLDEDSFSIVLGTQSKKKDRHLTTRGDYLSFNEFNQSLAYRDEVDADNQNLRVKIHEEAKGNRYNVLDVKTTPIIMRTKLFFDLLAGKALDISSSSTDISGASKGYRFGIDLGMVFPAAKSWALGLYGGFGLASTDMTFSAKDLKYSLDYLSPVRAYNYSCKETEKLQDFVIPVYIESEWILAKWLTFYVDGGARMYINRKTELSPLLVTGNLGPDRVTEKVFDKFIDPANYTREPYDIVIMGRAGVDICLVKKLLFFYVAYDFEWGLKPSYSSSRDFFNRSNYVYPIYYSLTKSEDVSFRSLIGSVSYGRKAGTVSAGIKIKF